MKCEYCGHLNLRNSETCAYCGSSFSELQIQKQLQASSSYAPPKCSNCHHPLSASHTFCPKCHKISSDIIELLKHNPTHPPRKFSAFYDESRNSQLLRCPHCKQQHRKQHVLSRLLDNPLVRCKHCRLPFIDPYVYDWSTVSTMRKIHYCFFANQKWVSPIIIWLLLNSFDVNVGLWAIPISAAVWIGHLCVMHYDTILDSLARRKANPEYDYILERMGYPFCKSKRN